LCTLPDGFSTNFNNEGADVANILCQSGTQTAPKKSTKQRKAKQREKAILLGLSLVAFDGY